MIRGTAVNADGKTRGLFNPSPEAHAALICRAYEKAGILEVATKTPLVECHGTGTTAGDPLELSAVAQVLGGSKDEDKFTYIGSVSASLASSYQPTQPCFHR